MPKSKSEEKSSKKEIKENSSKLSQIKEKEDILREIAESIKKDSEKEKAKEGVETDTEESGLEEEIGLNLRDLGFQEFMQSGDAKSPVLERIAGSQPRPIFVGGIPQTRVSGSEEKNEDDTKYVPNINRQGEAVYTGSTHIETEIETLDISKEGRERIEVGSRNVPERFIARENRDASPQSVERVERAKQYDVSKAGRESREEVKYKKHDPKKLPRSW